MKKGIFVGTFDEKDLQLGIDKVKVAAAKQETGLKYTNTEYVKKRGQIVGIKIWVCSIDDCDISMAI